MAIFGVIKTESVIQVSDKIRIDASKTFVSKDEAAITLIEIEPETGGGYIDVTAPSFKDWYLDWSYSGASRDVVCNLRITTDGTPVVFSQTIQVKTEEDDKLFSTDADILNKRDDLLGWLKAGRSSFLNFHRQARDLILSKLDDEGKTDINGDRLTADAFVDVQEVKEISAYWTLGLIFKNLSNSVGDVFERDAEGYMGEVSKKWNRAFLRYDKDGDAAISQGEGDYAFSSIRVYRE